MISVYLATFTKNDRRLHLSCCVLCGLVVVKGRGTGSIAWYLYTWPPLPRMIYVTLALLCIVCSCEGERLCCMVSVYLATFTKNDIRYTCPVVYCV